jgi:hypothetical protein
MTALVVLLALGGLALGTFSAPAVHAGSGPTITATGRNGAVSVTGSGFTPKGTVVIRVYFGSGKFENRITVTASGPHWVCRPDSLGTLCYLDKGGEISAAFGVQPKVVRVHARDLSTGELSNWARAFVYPAIIP